MATVSAAVDADDSDPDEVPSDDFGGQCCRTSPMNHVTVQRWQRVAEERRKKRHQQQQAAAAAAAVKGEPEKSGRKQSGSGGAGGGARAGGGGSFSGDGSAGDVPVPPAPSTSGMSGRGEIRREIPVTYLLVSGLLRLSRRISVLRHYFTVPHSVVKLKVVSDFYICKCQSILTER